ncbi:hypothetical protein EV175_006342, partial [Coemansia sp. RSA 1933]
MNRLLRPPMHRLAYHGRRSLWAAASSSNISLVAAASECASRIKRTVTGTQTTSGSCFVLVSQSYPPTDIDCIVDILRQRLASVNRSISFAGAVVDHVVHGADRWSVGNGISVLYSNSTTSMHPFYMGDKHGRQRLREVSVGRWHNSVTDQFSRHADRAQWIAGRSSATQAASHMVLPPELLDATDSAALVDLVLFATDRESRQALDLLDTHFPEAAKIGLVGSQTPFVNGREYTLFSGSQMYSSGMVGFAFTRSATQGGQPVAGHPIVSHGGLVPISQALRIVRCKGNVILELENGDAAHSLIASIRKRREEMPGADSRDHRLFAKISQVAGDALALHPVVVQVTGGDPAKGGLALDTLRDLKVGQTVQFMMLADSGLSVSGNTVSGPALLFGAADFANTSHGSPELRVENAAPGVFGGVTEGGFVYGRPSARTSAQCCESSVLS